MKHTVTAVERYAEAIQQLKTAEEALDQASAMFRDFGLHNYSPRNGKSLTSLADLAQRLLSEFETFECEECGKPLASNEACLANTCHQNGGAQ